MAPLLSLVLPLLLMLAMLPASMARGAAAHLKRHGVTPSSLSVLIASAESHGETPINDAQASSFVAASFSALGIKVSTSTAQVVVVQTQQTTIVLPPGVPIPSDASITSSVGYAASDTVARSSFDAPTPSSELLSATAASSAVTERSASSFTVSSSAQPTSAPGTSSLDVSTRATSAPDSSTPASAPDSSTLTSSSLYISTASAPDSSTPSSTAPVSTALPTSTQLSSASVTFVPSSMISIGNTNLPTSLVTLASTSQISTSEAPTTMGNTATSGTSSLSTPDPTMTGLTGDPTQCPGCLDWLAYLYITIAVIYTILIGIGLVLLTCHRDRLAVRMRSFALTVAAVLVIHSYLFLIFVVYAIRWWYPCIDEYWVMALVFPLGLALYNATNARLIFYHHVNLDAVTSINYLQRRHRLTGNCVWWKSPIFILVQYIKQWYGELGFLGQTYLSIIGLMGIQAIVSIVVFFGSYNFHESYGFFGKWTGASNCFRGSNGEWIPTILWQFGWTWFFGPYCLYRTRMIQDTHYWAFQTRISVLAGLPGTPLWLLFLYSDNPTIARINAVFPHAGWLIPGLVAMQMSLILCPLLDYWKGAKWDRIAEAVEKRNKEAAVGTRSTTTLGSNDTTRTEAKSRANKISVLEHTLDSDASDALLMFAGNVQMSAENVLFCRSVLHLRKKAAMVATCTNGFALRGLYEDAIALFYTLVNPETSRLPINIDAKMYDEIAEWFRGATYEYMPCGLTIPAPEDRIAPWISSTCQYPDMKNLQTVDRAFERMANLRAIQINDTPRDPAAKAQPVPAGFSIDAVYDKAYLHIRTLIFHNTWSAFLDTQPAGDLEEMGEKSLSRETSITTAPPSYDWTSEEARAQAQQAFESARLARSDPAPDYSERNPAANEFASRTVDFDESELPPAATRQHIQNRDAISAARARVARASALDGADDCVDLVEKV